MFAYNDPIYLLLKFLFSGSTVGPNGTIQPHIMCLSVRCHHSQLLALKSPSQLGLGKNFKSFYYMCLSKTDLSFIECEYSEFI